MRARISHHPPTYRFPDREEDERLEEVNWPELFRDLPEELLLPRFEFELFEELPREEELELRL